MGKQEEERRFSTSLRRISHRRRSQLPTTSISSQRSFYGCPRHTQSDSKSCPSTGYLSSPTPTLTPTTPSETLDPPSQPFISTAKEHPSPSLSSFLDGIGEPSRTTVVHSCNGLLLCCDSHFPVSCYGKGRQYIICNPTTKQYTILPISHPFESYNRRLYTAASWHAYLALDPSRSPHYKVLLFRHVLRLPFELDVYCSQRKFWNKVFPNQRYCGGGVSWNGAFHLLIHDNGLWRFDLDTEEMTVMPHPPTPQIRTPDKIKFFGESGGSLILIQSCSRYATGLQILEMDKDYCGWMVKCQVDLRPLILENPEIKSESKWEVKVLFVVKEEKENDFALVLAIPNKIVSYNLKRKTWNVLHEHGLGHNCFVKGFPFIESLSPI